MHKYQINIWILFYEKIECINYTLLVHNNNITDILRGILPHDILIFIFLIRAYTLLLNIFTYSFMCR